MLTRLIEQPTYTLTEVIIIVLLAVCIVLLTQVIVRDRG